MWRSGESGLEGIQDNPRPYQFLRVVTPINTDADRIRPVEAPFRTGTKVMAEKGKMLEGVDGGALRLRPDESIGLITPMAGHHIGVILACGFTADQERTGIFRLHYYDLEGKRETALALLKPLEELPGLFLESHSGRAQGLIYAFYKDSTALLMTSSTCSELGIGDPRVKISWDPSVKPITQLLKSSEFRLPVQTLQQMQPLAGLEDIFPRR